MFAAVVGTVSGADEGNGEVVLVGEGSFYVEDGGSGIDLAEQGWVIGALLGDDADAEAVGLFEFGIDVGGVEAGGDGLGLFLSDAGYGSQLAGGGGEDLVDAAEVIEEAGESFGADAGDEVEAEPFFDEFLIGMVVLHGAPFGFTWRVG